MIRQPVVAGSFYPGTKAALEKDLKEFIQFTGEQKKVIGLIAPHAGYIYSASCAGKGYGMIKIPDHVVILGVNHHGYGYPLAVDGHDLWHTPLGDISLDDNLRKKITDQSHYFQIDSNAGIREHSLEVQVPFIQYLNPNATILPITVATMRMTDLIEGGKELGSLLKGREDVLLVASTDMSHYISADAAKGLDEKAIEKIVALDPEGLLTTVSQKRITMCGVGPTVMMLSAALEMGAQSAEVIDYTNSGVVSGDYDQVVAYLSAIIH